MNEHLNHHWICRDCGLPLDENASPTECPTTPADRFRRWLADRATARVDLPDNFGLRFLEVNAKMLSDLWKEDPREIASLWERITADLPEDVLVVNTYTDAGVLLQKIGSGTYYDAYLICLASASWPVVELGYEIPTFTVQLRYEPATS